MRRSKKPAGDARLSRARVIDAGLALLAKRGRDGVSMRALADVLGTAPMSLYRHVQGKDDLLRAIVAKVLERMAVEPPATGPWTDRVAAWMHGLRDGLRRSPAAVAILIEHGQYAPALLRATNTLLRILREAGFDRPDAVRACREIMWSTLGFVSAELRGPAFSPSFYMDAIGGDGALASDDVAEVAAHMPHLLTRDLDGVFAAIVRHLLSGLADELAASTVRPAPRRLRGAR
jgi:TetR/AcrR family transcriptional regulator, tetracycline repressor protein